MNDLWNLLCNEQVRLQETTYGLIWPERGISTGRIWARRDITAPTFGAHSIQRYDDATTGLRTFTAPESMYFRLDIPRVCRMDDITSTLVTNPGFGYTNKLAEVMWNSTNIRVTTEAPIIEQAALVEAQSYVLGNNLPPPPLVTYGIEKDIKSLFGDKMAGIIMRKIK